MKKLNNELSLGECQDERIWIHSNTLGYGKWIANLRLVSIIQSLSKTQNPKSDSASAEVVELPLSDSSADSSKVCHCNCHKGGLLDTEVQSMCLERCCKKDKPS